jgi:oligopeptide/dipeptide ABC transporter ATP-binding protein
LAEVGLPEPDDLLNKRAFELSGGMRQRALVALALAARPALLIADEPTTALDPERRTQLVTLLQTMCATRGMALLLITHDLETARAIATTCAVMYAGQLVEMLRAADLGDARHPYTRALWRSLPAHGARGEPFATIEGQVPDGLPWPDGCRFGARCERASPACAASPPVVPGPNETMVRCVRAADACT